MTVSRNLSHRKHAIPSPTPLPLFGRAVAVFATARHLARLIYRMLRYGHDYVDIGDKVYDHRFQTRRLAALTETARALGYSLVPTVATG